MQGFQGEFLWQGTADVSAWLAVPAALRVMRAVGIDTWRQHNSSLLGDAVSLLSRALNTDHVVGEDIVFEAGISLTSYTHRRELFATLHRVVV